MRPSACKKISQNARLLNMNQISLEMRISFVPEKKHPAHEINALDEAIEPQFHYTTGRSREYKAEVTDLEDNPIPAAMTKGGRSCTIQVNAELEYFKAKQRDQLSNIDMRNVRLMLSPFLDI